MNSPSLTTRVVTIGAAAFICFSTAHAQALDWVTTSPGGDGIAGAMIGCSNEHSGRRAVEVQAGFAYVTGCSDTDSGSGYLTAKFDADGQVLWTKRYTFTGLDAAYSLAIDTSGNVGVAGNTAIIVYGADGDLRWTLPQSLHVQGTDTRPFIGGDGDGNWYIAGTSAGGTNFAVLKYDSAGQTLWSYVHSTQTTDIVTDFEMAADGTMVLTGSSLAEDLDVLTIRLGADGDLLWEARYDTGSNANQMPRALNIDEFGNAFVAIDNGSWGIDTVKYDTSGALSWASTFSAQAIAHDITTDELGNVYVVGNSLFEGQNRFLTIKFDAAGSELWSARYASTGTASSSAYEVVIDNHGVIIAAGHSYNGFRNQMTTVRYSASGSELSVEQFGGFDVAALAVKLDGTDNILVFGSSYVFPVSPYTLAKFDAAGSLQWSATHSEEDHIYSELPSVNRQNMAADPQGNLYVVGHTEEPFSSSAKLYKFASNGEEVWARRYRSAQFLPRDYAFAVSVGIDGRVCVTGSSELDDRSEAYLTSCYSDDGTLLWESFYNALPTIQPHSIAIDSAGNVLVGGRVSTQDGIAMHVLKYDTLGNELWSREYFGESSGSKYLYALAIDSQDSVIVGGYAHFARTTSLITAKFNSAGGLEWANEQPGDAIFLGRADLDIAVDAQDNVYMAWSALLPGQSSTDFHVAKFLPGGQISWLDSYHRTNQHGHPIQENFVYDLSLAADGSIIVTGDTGQLSTVSWNAAGQRLWEASVDGPNSSRATVAVDSRGNSWVSSTLGTGNDPRVLTVKYSASGEQRWINVWDGPAVEEDAVFASLALADGSVALAGRTRAPDRGNRILVMKFGNDILANGFE